MQSLDAASLASFLAEREVAVVLLFAADEDTYLRARGILEGLAREFEGVHFGTLSTDELAAWPDFWSALDLLKAPATLFYKKGTRVQVSIGIGYAEIYRLQIERTLKRLLQPDEEPVLKEVPRRHRKGPLDW